MATCLDVGNVCEPQSHMALLYLSTQHIVVMPRPPIKGTDREWLGHQAEHSLTGLREPWLPVLTLTLTCLIVSVETVTPRLTPHWLIECAHVLTGRIIPLFLFIQ